MAERLDVLLVQAAAIDGYPPTMNQANILAESGLSVGVLDMWHPAYTGETVLRAGIRRWPGARQWLSYQEPPPPLWRRFLSRRSFAAALRKIRREWRPRVEIGFDAIGCRYLGPPGRSGATTIWHLHEHPDPRLATSRGIRGAQSYLRENASRADLVVVPDEGRGRLMVDEGIVTRMPTVVRNCPRKLERLPTNLLASELERRGLTSNQVVLYQGSVSAMQCADTAVKSIAYWPAGSLLAFLGPIKSVEREKLAFLAREMGGDIAGRIVFLPPVRYRNLFGHTVGGHVGLGMILPRGDNLAYCAGASNKRYEYMACGVPQVANVGHGMRELIEGTGCGVCVDPESAEAVGKAVRRLLEDEGARRSMGECGRAAHLERLNYEREFQPVLEFIRSRLS